MRLRERTYCAQASTSGTCNNQRALEMARDVAFSDPIELLDTLLPGVFGYAKKITERVGHLCCFGRRDLVDPLPYLVTTNLPTGG